VIDFMSNLIRFGVSIDDDLLEKFDVLSNERGYANRSEALRDLIRDNLIQKKVNFDSDAQILGSLTLVYDHHSTTLLQAMAEIQHKHHDLILSVMHLHVNHTDCLEILALSGKTLQINSLADELISLKGVKHGKLCVTLPSSEIHKQ
jgi:CopG family transcriptional regulator, nickel-responsive regulator